MEQEASVEVADTEADVGADNVEHESFLAAEEEVADIVEATLHARLTDCEYVEGSAALPSEYVSSYANLTWDHYYVFDAELQNGDSVTVVSPVDEECAEAKVRQYWADADSVGGLAGQSVPVKHVTDDVYRVAEFKRGSLNCVPLPVVEWAMENGHLTTRDGTWRRSSLFTLLTEGATLSMLGLVIALGIVAWQAAGVLVGSVAGFLGFCTVLYLRGQLRRRTK